MRLALYLSVFANLILALESWNLLPERVAIHFGAGGVPDGWGSSLTATGLSVGLSLLLFGVLTCSADLVRRVHGFTSDSKRSARRCSGFCWWPSG
ncbi:DUF1648 domain-containing protein [Allochromatium humboldtianum]|uniref:DUF1648 domain-containing protein n=1 Tax=Allochromatium humboldtianum TaxID=504901 RepID=A0A850RF40_9GAMM|nr:DUF1648 domain-containing protein [Allochromatium humboldtianum]NVZ08271.1 DUF1648 domain-containing protein [Allochromatium humboldtianum]